MTIRNRNTAVAPPIPNYNSKRNLNVAPDDPPAGLAVVEEAARKPRRNLREAPDPGPKNQPTAPGGESEPSIAENKAAQHDQEWIRVEFRFSRAELKVLQRYQDHNHLRTLGEAIVRACAELRLLL